ncbi:MAG TPA: hypothetical protein VFA89_16035 [Terriglobales bacterium]|nr:hypothetical protein [Terriglobales bacterium]
MVKIAIFIVFIVLSACSLEAQNVCTTSTTTTQSVATRLNNAISACLSAGGGTVDARLLVAGTGGGIDAEVDVGNTSGTPITVQLPVNTTWGISINDSTKCGIRVYPRGALIGQDAGNGKMLIDTNSGSLVKAEICVDGAGSSGSVRLEAFQLMNRGGASTILDSLLLLQGIQNGSTVQQLNVVSNGVVGVHIGSSSGVGGNVCCMTLTNNWFNGAANSGSRPVVVEASASAGASRLTFVGNTIENPGSGQYALEVHGYNGYSPSNITFINTNTEIASNGDMGTPLVLLKDTQHVTFLMMNGIEYNIGVDPFMLDIQESAPGRSKGNMVWSGRINSTNWVKDETTWGNCSPSHPCLKTGPSNDTFEKYDQNVDP